MILIPTIVSSLYTFIMRIIAKGNVQPPGHLAFCKCGPLNNIIE